ncbi:pectate lyase [Paenibacillus solanacearum]|uniref:pectate lyase n=1 Tax=Paenibacillus solanacearum TaxID=2048548 RepID=UPI001C4073CE|nr:pectate lyase [Paenibacillus solanacearum]
MIETSKQGLRALRAAKWIGALLAFCLTASACQGTVTQETGSAAGGPKEPLHIVKAEAVGASKVEVTFSGKLASFDPKDISLVGAAGTWSELDPKLTRFLTVRQTSTRADADNRTVAVFDIEQQLNADATLPRPEVKDPRKIALLTAKYYTGSEAADRKRADNLLTWQTAEGGWDKALEERSRQPWSSGPKSTWHSKSGGDLGTIDNDGTTNELLFLSLMYKETQEAKYKESVRKGVDFLLNMQYPSGGWPQVYPARGNYSDDVTFNDNAMMHVVEVLQFIGQSQYPFDTDVIDAERKSRIQKSLDRATEYILKSQIRAGDVLTAWCAQHDPVTYEPRKGRDYEHPSISGSESAAIVKYLMSIPNPPEAVRKSIDAALQWFEAARVKDTKWEKTAGGNNFVPAANSSVWYRFYEIGTNKGMFSGRDGVIKYSVMEIEDERRNGYAWGGTWPLPLLNVAKSTGYYENRVYARVVAENSKDAGGQTLRMGELKVVGKPDTTK